MEELNSYINEALRSGKKLEFLTNMVTAMGYDIKDHVTYGGAETIFSVTSPEHPKPFGIAVFVDRTSSTKPDRSLIIKIKSQFIENDIENARDKIEEFLDTNHVKYDSVKIKDIQAYSFMNGRVKFKGVTIHMPNKYCPWHD